MVVVFVVVDVVISVVVIDIFLSGVYTKITWFKLPQHWYWFRIGKQVVKFIVESNGFINVNHHNIKLLHSQNSKLAAKYGWMFFKFAKHTIYIRYDVRHKRINILLFGGACKKSGYGLKHYCGKTKLVTGKQITSNDSENICKKYFCSLVNLKKMIYSRLVPR